MTTHELVHVQVDWFAPGSQLPILDGYKPHAIWFKVINGAIELVEMPYKESIFLYGRMTFEPINTNSDFYITPYMSNIDIELADKGVHETFAVGDDVERLATIALDYYNTPELNQGVPHYWVAIAVYEVAVSITHTDDGNESDLYYELLGILDNARLPSALLVETDPLPEHPQMEDVAIKPEFICKCGNFEGIKGDEITCKHCGGLLF